MSEFVSRRDVINAIEGTDWYHINKKGKMVHGSTSELESWYKHDDIMDAVGSVPSAEPERETAKFVRWMECKKTVNYISHTPHCKCSKCGTEFIIDTIKYCYMCGARMER